MSVGKQIGIIRVLWSEGITEIRVDHSAVTVAVVTSNESICVILMTEYSILLQAFLKLRGRHPAFRINISKLEGIKQIKIAVLNQLNFCVF